jgi:signal transduction histidine kinase
MTLAIALLPWLSYAYPAGLTRIATETALALMTWLAAFVLIRRSPRSPTDRQLLLCAGILTLAACAGVQMVGRVTPDVDIWWAMYAGALGGGALLAIAAAIPDRDIAGSPLRVAAVSIGVLGIAVASVRFAVAAPPRLANLASLDADRPFLDRPVGMLAVHVGCALAFALAAGVLARRAARTDDALMRWLALAAALEAVARVNLFLFPPVPTGWLHIADVCRLLAAALLLIGVAQWEREATLRGVRRRIARDLHDGVAQELAFICRRAPRLAGHGDRLLAGEILDAAQRAVEHAERAVVALGTARPGALADTVKEAAERAATREGIALDLVLTPSGEAPEEVCDALARIAGEAVTNAGRHGGACTASVRLSPDCLRIVDDGVGFVPDRARGPGFGLVSMRERAAEIGATLSVSSQPGIGTEVLVWLR